MNNQKVTYRFIFDRKKQAKGSSQGKVELVIYFGYQRRKYISTKISLLKNQWNRKQQIVINHPNADMLNFSLQKLKYDIERLELETIRQNKEFTPEVLNNYLKGEKPAGNFSEFYEDQLQKEHSLLRDTVRDQRRTFDLLCDFRQNIKFSEVDYKLIKHFDDYLFARGYSKNTVWKHHKNLKKYINLAINFGYLNVSDYPYRNFRPKKERTKREFLKYDELKRIDKLELSEVPLFRVVRDIFLFQCYTGLRFSDVIALLPENFTEKGVDLILSLFRMKKVDRGVTLNLSRLFDGKPADIILPYLKNFDDTKNIWGINVSNAKMNAVLKEIQHLAEIDTVLTTHLGRHTFGTLYAHQTGSIFEVMKAMGIAKFETAQVYITLSNEL